MRHRTSPTSYQGRPLPHPDEELVDQGFQFDVATVLQRRTMLRAFGLGAVGLSVAACADDGSTTEASAGTGSTSSTPSTSGTPSTTTDGTSADATEIPEETAGPYPGDGSNGPDVLSESGVVRRDITSSIGSGTAMAEGVPMELELAVSNLAEDGSAFAGVAVYVWHCDREGRYSLYSSGVEGESYLRGVQVADADGVVRFTSVFPACYPGRWPHIHFEVYPDLASITDASSRIATSQVALPKDVCTKVFATEGYDASVGNLAQLSLAGDNVFGDDGGVHQLGTVTGSVTDGLTIRLAVPVDTRTAAGTGSGGPGGGPGGPGGPPPR